MKITFGKYKGRGVENYPLWYLRWLLRRLDVDDPLAVEISWVLRKWEQTPREGRRK